MNRALKHPRWLAAVAVVAGVLALGATTLRPAVMGGGGNTSTSAHYVLGSTNGQPAPIGIATSTSYQLRAGYWYSAGPKLISCGSGADGADPDADALTNLEEGLNGTNQCDDDTDSDLCDDGEEVGKNESLGGKRDPLYFWDFYDVSGDASIDTTDTVLILGKFGIGSGAPGYNHLYDRWSPDSTQRWRTGEATGTHLGIDVEDAIANLQSFGHSCFGPP